MLKREELADPQSCLNRAADDELIFVLLGRDVATRAAIRAWIDERIRLGKNTADDQQIRCALRCMRQAAAVPGGRDTDRGALYREIDEERARQDARHGGPEMDDLHSPAEWVAIACRHLGLAVDDGAGSDPARMRRQFLRVAAVCLAALESRDRKDRKAAVAGDYSRGSGY